MATKKVIKGESDRPDVYTSNVTEVTIDEYVYQEVLKYGANVSIFRSNPSFKDGLIPVVRRSLFSFYESGATYDKPRKKAASLLGPVSSYHPHGDLSIQNAFRNEIKPYETNACLYDTHGNIGSLTGQKSAAVRYLDTRLSKFACYCFFHKDDYFTELLDMVETYGRDKKEPVTLPSRYPYMMLNNTTGIAWGNSFSMIPFNLEEVFRLTQQLIKNPEMTGVYLYPDSPRGYDIIESDYIKDICESGEGTLKIQAKITYGEITSEKKTGKKEVIQRYLSVTGFPEQTVMDTITQEVSKLILSNQLPGARTWRDKCNVNEQTGEEHVEFWVLLTPDADADYVRDTLYQKTKLRHHLALNFNFAARTKMQHLGLKDCLLMWISNRIAYKGNVVAKKVFKIKEKINQLEGIQIMLSLDNINQTIDIIKTSNDIEEANKRLVDTYGVTSYQAGCISSKRLMDLTKKVRKGVDTSLISARKELKEQMAIMLDSEKIKDIIYEELEEGIKLFGKPRHCKVISADNLTTAEYKYNIVVTKNYVKKLSASTEAVGTINSDDEVVAFFKNVSESTPLYLINDDGQALCVKLDKLLANSTSQKGNDIKSLFKTTGSIIKAFVADKIQMEAIMRKEYTITMFTESGLVKQSDLSEYVTSRSVLQGISLNDADKLCYVLIYDYNDYNNSPYVLIYTEQGSGIAIDLQTISYTSRVTKGVNYLALLDDDKVRGVCPAETDRVLVVTNKGYCKICDLDDIFKTSKRKATMIKLSGLSDGDTVFKIVAYDKDKTYTCILQSGDKIVIDPESIPYTTRISKGKKMIPVKRGDSIIKLRAN